MVEQGTHKPLVVSSTLTLATSIPTEIAGIFICTLIGQRSQTLIGAGHAQRTLLVGDLAPSWVKKVFQQIHLFQSNIDMR